MKDINRRNTETVEQVIKDMYNKIQEQHIRIDQLNTAISSMSERMNSLEQLLITYKVKSIGTGPTVL
jgi:prefoldin subunit 5